MRQDLLVHEVKSGKPAEPLPKPPRMPKPPKPPKAPKHKAKDFGDEELEGPDEVFNGSDKSDVSPSADVHAVSVESNEVGTTEPEQDAKHVSQGDSDTIDGEEAGAKTQVSATSSEDVDDAAAREEATAVANLATLDDSDSATSIEEAAEDVQRAASESQDEANGKPLDEPEAKHEADAVAESEAVADAVAEADAVANLAGADDGSFATTIKEAAQDVQRVSKAERAGDEPERDGDEPEGDGDEPEPRHEADAVAVLEIAEVYNKGDG